MQVSNKGLDLIKESEGLRLEPYKCSAGVPTIGYGSTYYEDGSKVTMSDSAITEERATFLLKEMVDNVFSVNVNRKVEAKINQNQFDALVSFSYNVGNGNFNESTLLKKINVGDFEGAADEFLRWNKAGGKVVNGLTIRREKERELFLS